jgi:hypothetical protein
MMATAEDAALLKRAAPSSSVAVGVPQQLIAGTPDFEVNIRRARMRLAKIIKGAKKVAYYPMARYSSQSLARRLAPPFFLLAAFSYHDAITSAQ